MGQVYAGEQPMIGKQVAIKVLSSDLVQDQSLVQRLLEEARAVNLIHHPNIIDIFAFGTLPDRRPYFVMEYLEGEDLEAALCRDAVSRADLTALIEQLCQTLAAAHAAGFVHRDLKPENLWLARKPDHTLFLKILDFGIAKNTRLSSPSLTTNGQVLGTAHYMAPEQALARTVDGRTDIYSMGVILYRILAGVLPFDDPNVYAVVTKHVTEPPRPLSFHRKVPSDVERVVMRCLAKDPAQRPQTVSQLWSEMRPALEAWPISSSSTGLAATLCDPVQGATIASPNLPANIFKTDSRTTIQPVGETHQNAQSSAGSRRRVVGASVAATLVIAGGIGLYLSLGGAQPHSPQPSIAPPSSSFDSTLVNPPVSAGQPPANPMAAGHGERDSGAGDARSSPPHAPTWHPSKKANHENGSPVRL